jgi:hypothetical protein
MIADQENTTTSKTMIDTKVIDDMELRIHCARAILSALSIYQREAKPSDEVLADALYGVDLLLEDATSKI